MFGIKTILIILPVFLLLIVLIGLRIVGKKPSTQAVNLYSSLLLLGYFLATTGLGIFWVARQHLPVFDLHYLLGYVTCLLVGFHVYVNRARLKLRFRAQPAGADSPPKTKRGLKGGFALLIVGGLGVAVGLKINGHASSIYPELAAGGMMHPAAKNREKNEGLAGAQSVVPRQRVGSSTNSIPLASYYHNATKNSRWNPFQNQGLDWSTRPTVFKAYPLENNITLPPPDLTCADPTGAVMDRQKRANSTFKSGKMTAVELSTILMLNNGVTGVLEYPGVKYHLRAAPSAGALYPTITYVLINSVDGIPSGLYHYNVKAHQLHPIDVAPGLTDKWQHCVATPALMEKANVVLIYTANFYRSSWKYGKRAYRYILLDTGHVVKNALLGAEACGFQGHPIGCFDDQRINDLLQLDGNEEGALLLLPLGKGKAGSPITRRYAVNAAPKPLAGSADELVLLMHGCTELALDHTQSYLCASNENRVYEKKYPELPVIDLPDAYDAGAPLTATIKNRRSVREWSGQAITLAQLSAQLYYSFGVKNDNGAYQVDPVLGNTSFLNMYLIVNQVDGLAPGVYYYHRQQHNLSQIQTGDFRRAIYNAALSQGVVDGCGVCFVITTSNELLNHPDGDRSFRYAEMEAGMIGENIYLQTQALGLGCTGIGAYFDDEVSELIQVAPEEESITYLLATSAKK